jgi:hypothetical protein
MGPSSFEIGCLLAPAACTLNSGLVRYERQLQAERLEVVPSTEALGLPVQVRFLHARATYSTLVPIHQVVPPGSRNPPRLSSSPFLTGSCTDAAPASSARRYVASTSLT